MKRMLFVLLVLFAMGIPSRVVRADDWDLENMPPKPGTVDNSTDAPATQPAPTTQPAPVTTVISPDTAVVPVADSSPAKSESPWVFNIGAGIMPFGAKQNSVPGVLDQEHMYSLPLGVGYYLTRSVRIDSGIELQFYNAYSSMPYAGLSSFNAFTMKVPLTVSYEATIPSSPLFFDAGAGVAVNIPVSARLINSAGIDVSSNDYSGNYYLRTRVGLQDEIVFAAGAQVSSSARLKLQLDLSPIAMSSNPILMSTSPYALPDPAMGPYLGYSPVVLSLRLEMLSF